MFLAYTLAHYFFPRHSNNHKAKILHSSTLFLVILSLITYQVVLQALPRAGVKILGYAANIPPATIVELTNQRRAEIGLSSLGFDPALSAAARLKGEDMIAKNYWAHVAPDGTQPWKFFIDSGYKYKFAGENLARDFSDPGSAVEAWMASPSHRENLLSPKYGDIGVAVVEGELNGIETTLVVQLFGTRFVDTSPQVPVARAETIAPPTTTPEVVPEPQVAEAQSEIGEIITTAPIAARINTKNILISPFDTTKGASLMTIGLLLVILVVDGLVVSSKKITRIGGRTFAHLAFLGTILVIVIIAKAGLIL